jgi:hypothetical protein
MMELTEDFLKLLQIAFIVTGVLAIFFTYIQYNIFVNQDKAQREAIIFGNYLLTSDCLTYENTKGLFSEGNLDTAYPACFNYNQGKITVELLDGTDSWEYEITEPSMGGEANFIVSVRLTNSNVKAAKMTVEL